MEAPWFRAADPLPADATIAVIGCGIGGLCAAMALVEMGASVRLYEAREIPGGSASGTPAAIVQPRAFVEDSVAARFHVAAYRRAIAFYDRLRDHAGSLWLARGLLALGRDDDGAARLKAFVGSGLLAAAEAQWLDEVDAVAGLSVGRPGAWFPEAGCLDTGRLCAALAASLDVRFGAPIEILESDGGRWRLLGRDWREFGMADAVVVAAGADTNALIADLGLNAKRGQVSLIPAGDGTRSLSCVITFGGYLTPAVAAGRHVLGATFETAGGGGAELRATDDDRNRELLERRVPLLRGRLPAPTAGWAGIRATTADTLPLVGPAPDGGFYRDAYETLRHGPGHRRFAAAKYLPGIYVIAGFGSRGFLTAPLAAETLAAVMLGLPVPADRALLQALHPGRFLVRALRRGKAGGTVSPSFPDCLFGADQNGDR